MESQPARTPTPIHASKAKPDPRPMRVALGFGGVAALSALAAAIVLPPRPVTSAPVAVDQPGPTSGDTGGQAANSTDTSPATSPDTSPAERPILYVQLAPGQTAPPGATVIDATALAPTGAVVDTPMPGTTQAAPPQAGPTQAGPAPAGPTQAAPPPVVRTPAPAPPVVRTAAPPPKPPPKPIIIKTTQSGKVVP
jgi:hypothetical protein